MFDMNNLARAINPMSVELTIKATGKTYQGKAILMPFGLMAEILTDSPEAAKQADQAMASLKGKYQPQPLFEGENSTIQDSVAVLTFHGVLPKELDRPITDDDMVPQQAGADQQEMDQMDEMLDRPIYDNQMGDAESVLKQFRPTGKPN